MTNDKILILLQQPTTGPNPKPESNCNTNCGIKQQKNESCDKVYMNFNSTGKVIRWGKIGK
jgi:hypothetical protein